jgi:hypothetical protein
MFLLLDVQMRFRFILIVFIRMTFWKSAAHHPSHGMSVLGLFYVFFGATLI